MRVLVITNDLPPRIGGIQYYVDQLCRGLAARGDDVTVYGSSYDGHAAWDAEAPYRVVRESVQTLLPGPRTLRHSTRLVEHTDAEVVLFGAAVPLGVMGPVLRRRTGVPFVAFTHGLEVSTARAPGGRHLLRAIGARASAVTFVSHWCDEMLRESFGPGPRYELLPPAVDPAVFHPGVDGTEVRRRLGVRDEPVVACVSRLVERKGQDQLIAALPEIRRRVPGTHLLLVGDGPHRIELESLAQRFGVADVVHLVGQVPDTELASYYAAADLFAMPCRERRGGLEVEAFGIVLIQAQAIGRPVVAGRIGGVPDAVGPRSGELVDGRHVVEVADAVASILEDPDRATAMGAEGSRFVAEQFTWDRRTDELRSLLRSVVVGV